MQFCKGDRVIYVGTYTPELEGVSGTVDRDGTRDNVYVVWDNTDNSRSGVLPSNIKLIGDALKLSDFKTGDRVEYTGSGNLSGWKQGTVTTVNGVYVRVKWDGKTYDGYTKDNGVYPYNLRKVPVALTYGADLSLAENLKAVAGVYREKAKAANRAADQAEKLAKEIETAGL